MSKQDWIDWLESIGARYHEYDNGGAVDQIYVFSKEEYDLKQAHPRRYKDMYQPYIRLSHFDTGEVYTRWNGYTSTMTDDCVKSIVLNGI